jgi:hypothetical protein
MASIEIRKLSPEDLECNVVYGMSKVVFDPEFGIDLLARTRFSGSGTGSIPGIFGI